MQTKAKKHDPDIIFELLEDGLEAFPLSPLLIGCYQQYQKRGFLTKKQLQGLHSKLSGLASVKSGKLATLEAIIKKMPNRFKSEKPAAGPAEPAQDPAAAAMLTAILARYPQHKRVLFLKAKYDSNELLSPSEIAELVKFSKLLSQG